MVVLLDCYYTLESSSFFLFKRPGHPVYFICFGASQSQFIAFLVDKRTLNIIYNRKNNYPREEKKNPVPFTMEIPPNRLLLCMMVTLLLSGCDHSLACTRCSRTEEVAKDESTVEYSSENIAEHSEKVWLFAVDGRKRPYGFLDHDGNLVGFDVDIVNAVCKNAKKQCKMVLAEFTECTLTERNINYPGRGLMSGWFDGCPSYVSSVDRTGAFDFTDPYLDTYATFTVAPGNPSGFNPDLDDYSSFTLTHLTGAVTNAKCLDRLKKKFGQIIVAEDLPAAKALLLNGTATALFSPRSKIDGLEVLPQRFRCDDGGTGVMLKKGSPLPQWWNPAFRKLVESGDFKNLCDTATQKYNKTIRCIKSPKIDSTLTFKPETHDSKVWLFSVSGRRTPFNFLDEAGRLTGFDVDFVDRVCKIAGKTCASVLNQFTECTFTNRNINYAGRGLMDGWVDACTGYGNTLDREAAFDFTDAYLKSSSFYAVAPGNPSGFDPSMEDYSKFTFTHLTGAYTNAKCLSRQGKNFGKIVVAENLPAAKALLMSGEADVLFSPRSSIPDLSTFSQEVQCATTGTSVMVKKGSPLPKWWNKAYREFVATGQFAQFCTASRVKYDYPIKCLSEDEMR